MLTQLSHHLTPFSESWRSQLSDASRTTSFLKSRFYPRKVWLSRSGGATLTKLSSHLKQLWLTTGNGNQTIELTTKWHLTLARHYWQRSQWPGLMQRRLGLCLERDRSMHHILLCPKCRMNGSKDHAGARWKDNFFQFEDCSLGVQLRSYLVSQKWVAEFTLIVCGCYYLCFN